MLNYSHKERSENIEKEKFNEYQKEYRSNKLVSFSIRLNKLHDADVIDQLNKQSNKRKYILDLIRNDIHK